MKRLVFAAIAFLSIATAGFSQTTALASKDPAKIKTVTNTEKKNQAKLTKTAVGTKPAATTVSPTATTKTHANAAVSAPKVVRKKDGTPDKRYSTDKSLKKDGTPDTRYKTNKKS